MEKRKKWHIYLVLCVFGFALYSIIPTIIYYNKPLHKVIDSKDASCIVEGIVNKQEKEERILYRQVNKILTCLKLLPQSINTLGKTNSLLEVTFDSSEEAKAFAASLISSEKILSRKSRNTFLESMSLKENGSSSVIVSLSNAAPSLKSNFKFIPKFLDRDLSSSYLNFSENVGDHIVFTTLRFTKCRCVEERLGMNDRESFSYLHILEDLETYKKLFKEKYYCNVVLPFIVYGNESGLKKYIREENTDTREIFSKMFLDEIIHVCEKSFSEKTVENSIEKSIYKNSLVYSYINRSHPLFESLVIDLHTGNISFSLTKEVLELKNSSDKAISFSITHLINREISALEKILLPGTIDKGHLFLGQIRVLNKGSGLLLLDNHNLADYFEHFTEELLRYCWNPEILELSSAHYPVFFKEKPKHKSPLGCYIFRIDNECSHFPKNAILVVFKGIHALSQSILQTEDQIQHARLKQDLSKVYELLIKRGFTSRQIDSDQVFYLKDFASFLRNSTKENFISVGEHIILETFDVKHRLLTNNKIGTESHEELVKWYDEYQRMKNQGASEAYLKVVPPVQNVFYENIKLNVKKYFSGDEKKILKWGLDLSGGKTVKVGFKDRNNKFISQPLEIDKAAEELSRRLNRLGVSEVSVRKEGNFVAIDFPSTENIPAEELVIASSMKFHVVNEKFSSPISPFYLPTKLFLDKVWAIAVSRNKCDAVTINKIAKDLLEEVLVDQSGFVGSQLKMLREEGLCIPEFGTDASRDISDTYSWIIKHRDYKEGQNPLTIVYYNYVLEGSDLTDIATHFDSKEGNILEFSVKKSVTLPDGTKINPSEVFYKWTSLFNAQNVSQSEMAKYTSGKGWRMAVVFNDSLVSAPLLNASLKDKAQITGAFSRKEISKLASDLKAGTMTYAPVIMSEDTVSPELGTQHKNQGIMAAIVGLAAVIVVMCVYYKMSGLLAVFAVIFNLLIIWGILQSIGAVVTLSGIAGIILAMGMAVDANVLVFERIREEIGGSLGLHSAVNIGYKRAFRAILDSNVTTILAAMILLFFDVALVKGFAVTLIIGILSSMFTSLFITKFFFSYWLEYSQASMLHMSTLFTKVKVPFVKGAKRSWMFSGLLVLLGMACLFTGRAQNLLSIDFKGGYVLSLNGVQDHSVIMKQVPEIFTKLGISSGDFHFRSLNRNGKVKIYFSSSGIDQLKQVINVPVVEAYGFEYQKDKALSSLISGLQQAGMTFDKEILSQIHLSWTGVSGQFSKSMKKQAIIGLLGALLIVLIYVCFRFEIIYAVSAVLALLHDLLVTCSVIVIAHYFVKSIQFDFQVIGALMTVLGYSLNNTIIIFDRIREKEPLSSEPFSVIVAKSINSTFSRTMMTTITTLVVVLSLLLFGGKALTGFALIMTSGVILGTLSSVYLAPALLIVGKRRSSSGNKENLFRLSK